MAKPYTDYATNTGEELEMQDLIDEKIGILYDMGILIYKYVDKHTKQPDFREDQVRELLKQCETRYEMDTILHDVVRGNMSINALLNAGIKYLRGGN